MSTNTPDSNQSDGQEYKDEETLRRLHHVEGLSLKDMADRLGCGKTTVHRWMDRLDVSRRDHKQAAAKEFRKEYATYRVDLDGYCIWRSYYNGVSERVPVHRLLAVAEYGFDAVGGKVVHHESGVPWDNRTDNIELMDNTEHSNLHHPNGEEHPNSKLTADEVREIKQLFDDTDLYQEEIGDMYGVSQKTISKINTGKKWGHIDP